MTLLPAIVLVDLYCGHTCLPQTCSAFCPIHLRQGAQGATRQVRLSTAPSHRSVTRMHFPAPAEKGGRKPVATSMIQPAREPAAGEGRALLAAVSMIPRLIAV